MVRTSLKTFAFGFSAAITVAGAASILFLAQGGFGGGHGEFDQLLFVLSLPWSMIPWPSVFTSNDFIFLVLLPFLLNVVVVVVIAAIGVREKQINS